MRAAATGLPASGDEGDPAGPARRPGRYCGRPAFPEEQHDGQITRRAPPDDVAVQSQAEGRRWVLSASGRRDLAGSRTGFAWPAAGPGGGRTAASASGTVPEDYSADGEAPGLPAARSREVGGLPAGQGRPGRVLRHRAAAVPGTGAAEQRARPDPAGARVRPDRRPGQSWRARQGTTGGGPGRSRQVTTYSWRKPCASSSKSSRPSAMRSSSPRKGQTKAQFVVSLCITASSAHSRTIVTRVTGSGRGTYGPAGRRPDVRSRPTTSTRC